MNIDTKLFNWIGGKKWMSSTLSEKCDHLLNNDIKYYIEPFCGSLGSVMGSIEVFKKHKVEKIILNDINTSLINTYLSVKNHPQELFELLKDLENRHIATIPEVCFSMKQTKHKATIKPMMQPSNEFYLSIRKHFNEIKSSSKEEDKLLSSAQFLYIMHRCFNGIYRENQSGLNNSPYGWCPKKMNLENKFQTIMEFNKFFNDMNVEFYNMGFDDFLNSIQGIKSESLFYFDPPYLNDKIKENSYSKGGFGIKDQEKLLDHIKNIKYIMYSNHDLELFKDFFNTDEYDTMTLYRKNNISSDNSTRKNDVAEILAFTK